MRNFLFILSFIISLNLVAQDSTNYKVLTTLSPWVHIYDYPLGSVDVNSISDYQYSNNQLSFSIQKVVTRDADVLYLKLFYRKNNTFSEGRVEYSELTMIVDAINKFVNMPFPDDETNRVQAFFNSTNDLRIESFRNKEVDNVKQSWYLYLDGLQGSSISFNNFLVIIEKLKEAIGKMTTMK